MAINQITTHRIDGLNRLMEQYKDKTLIRGHIGAFINQIQDLEDCYFTMDRRLNIAGQSGVNLDRIGKIVGEPRGDKDDPTYRVFLFARIGTNVSEGTPEDIINVFKLLTESPWVFYQNLGNAQIRLTSTKFFVDQDETNLFFSNTQKAVAGGVRINKIICADDDEAFTYSPENPQAQGLGYDDGTTTVGGEYATEYQFLVPFAYADITGEDIPGTAGYGAGSIDPIVGGIYE